MFMKDLKIGQIVATKTITVTYQDLQNYAKASADFNPIHLDENYAKQNGLPTVIAHGMLTMALVAQVVTDWANSPNVILAYQTKFANPLLVENKIAGTKILVTATIIAITEETITLEIYTTCGEQKILNKTHITIQNLG